MILVEDLTKIYTNGFKAISEVNFNINESGIYTLNGISGSGKSTILTLLAGFDKPTFGKIEILGEFISKLPEHHISKFRLQNIGFIFQSFNLFQDLSVYDNLLIPLIPLKLKKSKEKELIFELLTKYNLISKSEQFIKNLSGGEQQRVAIIRAFINRPKIILADEPTANLDYSNKLIFLEMIEELKEDRVILISTHDDIFQKIDKVRSFKIENGKLQTIN